MLHFSHSLLVCPLLFPLMLSVAGCELCVSVGGSVGVEHSHIKVCSLKVSTPNTIRCYVEPCSVLCVGCGAA